MAEQVYTYNVRRVTATPRSARLRANGSTVVVSSTTYNGTSSSSSAAGSSHTHDNLADLNRIATTTDGYLTLATSEVDDDGVIQLVYNKVKAGYADSAATADEATHAESADEADHATSADEATHAAEADHATKADEATHAAEADHATAAHQLDDDSPTYDKLLRKDQDDASSQNYNFSGLLTIAQFLSQNGTTGDFGTGFSAFLTANKAGRIETDELLVRNKAIFNELEIRKLSYTGGNIVLSPAGSVIERVTYITADGTEYEADENGLYVDASGNTVTPVTYRCYYKADDGTTATTNTWKEGDQARCQTFNLADISTHEATTNHFYWRLVTAVGNDYIDLSASDCADKSDAPAAQDTLVQMGNRYSKNADRQGFIYLQSEGTYAPCIEEYAGVKSYSLDGKVLTRISPTHPEGNLFTGKVQIVSGGQIVKQAVYRGDYDATATYEYYDQVTYNGDLWLCIVPEGKTATEAPSITSQQWKRQTDRDTDKTWSIDATLDGSEYIAESETRTLSASLLYGTDVMNSEVTDGWRIERDSGDAEADAEWNADAAHNGLSKEEALSYQFSQSDLNGKDSARFTVYASASLIPTNVVVLTAEDGTTNYTDETGITYTL